MRDATLRKRQQVIDIALEMFISRGYENVSVDEIIEAADISKGTFYHYFSSKEDLLSDFGKSQVEITDAWLGEGPKDISSLEEHINRLFLELTDTFRDIPRLVRSIFALSSQNEKVAESIAQFADRLREALGKWIPEREKIEALIAIYTGTVYIWSMEERDDLHELVRERLRLFWQGMRNGDGRLLLTPSLDRSRKIRVGVIGGGLAGLTVAAYLSEHPDVDGVLFERSPQFGGRAFTYEKDGFTLNYGAHAIYGIDRHTISKIGSELGLSFSSRQVDKRKVIYEKNGRMTVAPLDAINMIKTDLLGPMGKVRFVGEIVSVVTNLHKLKNYATLGDFLSESKVSESIKELWEHFVCSNFFISPEDARKVPGHVICEYYQNLFLAQRPVNYILGSWAVITNQLIQKIEQSGRWELSLREAVDEVAAEGEQYRLTTKKRSELFDYVIFAMPVQQVAKLLKGTPWESHVAKYEQAESTEVLVYDVGLKRIVNRPFSYISDMDHKLFISDISATDNTIAPPGGQLLQGIAYLHDHFESEEERKAYQDLRVQQMEQLFDRHYPGWRDEIAVKRMSKKAMVQSVKHIAGNEPMPIRIEGVPFFFCGDGCEGKGQLAERAFSSAREAAKRLMDQLQM
jgi:protoporphyrinogen oxidase/DNA-binding transcriptional regulator YbjK